MGFNFLTPSKRECIMKRKLYQCFSISFFYTINGGIDVNKR